jgi:predicted DNA-binding transcriptional regulator AlpA
MEHKARQSAKLRELAAVLAASGFVTLDEQAKALGLSRSTAWTILKGSHKASGLSTATISRMLSSPELPQCVRATILTYVEERMAGEYGHNKMQLRRFAQCRFYYRSDHEASPSK